MTGDGDDCEKLARLTTYAELLLMRIGDIHDMRVEFINDAKKEIKAEKIENLISYHNGIIAGNETTLSGIEQRMSEEIQLSKPKSRSTNGK